MNRLLACLLAVCAGMTAFAEGEEAGHLHGPDGRHLVAPIQGGDASSFILSHHDMRIEGADGQSILGAKVFSTITPKGNPDDVVHWENNVYEPENEVYGSHMTYEEPGEYLLIQDVALPDGRKMTVEFPVYVPALTPGDDHADAGEGLPIWALALGGGAAALALLYGAYRLGLSRARSAGAGALLLAAAAVLSLSSLARAEGEEDGHLHGPDGRHLVAPASGGSAPPPLLAFPAPDQGESVEKTVDGIKFVLSIENEEMEPDKDLVTVAEAEAKLIGLTTVSVQSSQAAGGLSATGQVSANPNGQVTVNSRAAGRIISLGALPGTTVRQGQTLAVIESRELAEAQAALKSAEASLAQSQSLIAASQAEANAAEARVKVAAQAVERQLQLAESGLESAPALQSAKAALAAARSRVKELNTQTASLRQLADRQQKGVQAGVVAQNDLERTLAELRQTQTELDGAEAEARLAAERLEQEEGFARQGLRSAQAIDEARGELELARAARNAANARLTQSQAERAKAGAEVQVARDKIALLGGRPGAGSRLSITAPISGEVEARHVSAGQTVASGDKLYELLNARLVWVLADIYESAVSQVRAGQEVEVFADALPGRIYRGTVAFVHNDVEAESRTIRARIVVENPGELLKQNMFVRVRVATSSQAKSTIPASALQSLGGQDIVFVEKAPGTYRRTPVKVLSRTGASAVIEGVEPGMKVVAEGAYQLQSKVAAR